MVQLKVYKEAHTSPSKRKDGQFPAVHFKNGRWKFWIWGFFSAATKILCACDGSGIRLSMMGKEG